MKKFIIIAAFVALTEAIGTQLIFVPTNTLPGASGNIFFAIYVCSLIQYRYGPNHVLKVNYSEIYFHKFLLKFHYRHLCPVHQSQLALKFTEEFSRIFYHQF